MNKADSTASAEAVLEAGEEIEQTSGTYVGRWNRLVTTTNWEKGRIISEWREALIAAQAPAAEYSDEAWGRRVGGVTGQHTGRLRRVYLRFGQVYEQFAGLYWSHFQAAVDWDDAEMWLEGAVQSQWSVLQMRGTRWETTGGADEPAPLDDEVVDSELDEDFVPAVPPHQDAVQSVPTDDSAEVQGPLPEGPDFGDDDDADVASDEASESFGQGPSIYSDDDERETVQFVRPFEHLADLPEDLAEAFESLKLAVLRHKSEDWQQISRDDLLASLDALKELVMAPSPDHVPV